MLLIISDILKCPKYFTVDEKTRKFEFSSYKVGSVHHNRRYNILRQDEMHQMASLSVPIYLKTQTSNCCNLLYEH
jgi:hypothetical protein